MASCCVPQEEKKIRKLQKAQSQEFYLLTKWGTEVDECFIFMMWGGGGSWAAEWTAFSGTRCQLLIREAMLMRFIDSLIRRTERPPAVAVCIPPFHLLLPFCSFSSASSSPLASSSQRGSCFHWTETAGGLLVFPTHSVMNTAEKPHLYHHRLLTARLSPPPEGL